MGRQREAMDRVMSLLSARGFDVEYLEGQELRIGRMTWAVKRKQHNFRGGPEQAFGGKSILVGDARSVDPLVGRIGLLFGGFIMVSGDLSAAIVVPWAGCKIDTTAPLGPSWSAAPSLCYDLTAWAADPEMNS